MDKKLAYGIVVAVVLAAILVLFGDSPRGWTLKGVSFDSPQYTDTNVASSTVNCQTNGATEALAASAGRTSFTAQNSTTSAIALCRGTTCGAKGIYLNTRATTTRETSVFHQDDGYTGAYSCRSLGNNTGTMDIMYSQ